MDKGASSGDNPEDVFDFLKRISPLPPEAERGAILVQHSVHWSEMLPSKVIYLMHREEMPE